MTKKHAYLVGIKGVAMTALSVLLKEKGYKVSGSDVEEVFPTDHILASNGIKVLQGFKQENINRKFDVVIVTGAHGGMTNIEAQTAHKMGIPTYMQGEFLGKVMSDKIGISVCGCHGKTTTSALIASLLIQGGLNPSFAVGCGSINDLGAAGHWGTGRYFIAEADEYMTCPQTCKIPRFMWQKPQFIVLTNIDYDHPDAFKNLEEVISAFKNFTNNLTNDGLLVACIDDKNTSTFLSQINKKVITYGFSPRADYRITNMHFAQGVSFMRVAFGNTQIGEFMIKIPGKHNLLNALAGAIIANINGISWERIKEYLKNFTGTKRRFEKIGEYGGKLFYDDYAHHPSEITATIAGVKEWFPDKRLVVIFQPHTFSRTKSLLAEFAKSFLLADLVLLTDIYPSARESYDATISSKKLAIESNKHKKNVIYGGKKESVLTFLSKNLTENDLLLTMGAGDIFLWQEDLKFLLNNL